MKAIAVHVVGLAAYYLISWILHSVIPDSRYAYLFLVTLDDFKHWYPHFYPLVYGAIHSLYILPYVAIAFSLLWWWRSAIVSRGMALAFICISVLFLFAIPSVYYLVSSALLLLLLCIQAPEESDIWQFASTRRLIVGFVLLALVMRIAWVLISDNNDNGDSAARLYVADIWLRLCCHFASLFRIYVFNPSYDWLPLPFYLSGISMALTGDTLYVPRFVTVVFGGLSVVPVFLISRQKFGQTTAVTAALIFTFYLQHVILSSQTLSEPFYLFFLLWAYYFIENLIANDSKIATAIGVGVALCCCCLVRYEGWFFTAMVLALVPFTGAVRWSRFAVVAFPPGIAIISIMCLEVAAGQHPLRGIVYSDYEVSLLYQAGVSKYFDILANLPVAYLPLYIVAMSISLYQALRGHIRQTIPLFILYWFTITPFVFKIMNQTLTCQSRYLSIYMVPAIPFIAYVLVRLAYRIRQNKYTLIYIISAYIILANVLMTKRFTNNPALLRYPKGFMSSATYLKNNVKKCRLYLDYARDLGTNSWSVYAQTIDIHRIYYQSDSDYLARHTKEVDSIFSLPFPRQCIVRVQDKNEYSRSTFDQLLTANQITHLMLFPEGLLSNELKFSKDQETINGHDFKRIFSEDGYQIYALQSSD